MEVEKRIASASKAFGALRQAVFKDAHLSVNTKRQEYKACVLSVLLYMAVNAGFHSEDISES